MPTIHCLTVGQGDCTLIEHGSGRRTMIDICGGNRPRTESLAEARMLAKNARGNFAMCSRAHNPLDYLAANGITTLMRFILTHPDMDHMDGLDALFDEISIGNFWHTGIEKEKPDFEEGTYNEADWDRYIKVKKGNDSANVQQRLAGAKFSYANRNEDGSKGGDYLEIVSPNQALLDEADGSKDYNDTSFIIVYRSAAGKIVIPGDAHDGGWEHAIENYPSLIKDVAFLLAPHHGRRSDRDWSFLSELNPRFSLLGCAPSDHLAYDAWRNRDLDYVTQNQVGNMVLEVRDGKLDVFVENDVFVAASGGDTSIKNKQGYYYLKTV